MQVQAVNKNGINTVFSQLPSTTTLQNPPTAPGAAGFSNVTTTQLQGNWIANGNPPGTSYTAILSTGASPGTNNFSGNISSTTTDLFALFQSLGVNTVYFVDVKATNTGGS